MASALARGLTLEGRVLASGLKLKSSSLASSSSFRGTALILPPRPLALSSAYTSAGKPVGPRAQTRAAADTSEALARFRLNNLAPQPGSRRKNKRKGRGYGAGQGGSCGFGMRGQKSRSGPNVRAGFEGGQMPLYRRLPKLKGIAGGMGAGLPKYVTVNLDVINSLGLPDNSEVSLQSLIQEGILNPSGRDRKLPLKVLGDGEVQGKGLTVKAAAFSASAKEKLEAAGCTVVVVPGRKKFLPAAVVKKRERAAQFYAAKEASA